QHFILPTVCAHGGATLAALHGRYAFPYALTGDGPRWTAPSPGYAPRTASAWRTLRTWPCAAKAIVTFPRSLLSRLQTRHEAQSGRAPVCCRHGTTRVPASSVGAVSNESTTIAVA